MKTIFVNGVNAKAGGGKSILQNYLTCLVNSERKHKYVVLAPDYDAYKHFEREDIIVTSLSGFLCRGIFTPLLCLLIIPVLMNRHNADLLFNLADIPVVTSLSQVFLFDWAYAVYPESVAWQRMRWREWFVRKSKVFFFWLFLPYVNVVIAQTEVVKKRLTEQYKLKNVKVVPNAVSLDHLKDSEWKDFRLPSGKKLLYLTRYYSHKNLEVFLPLAHQIRARGLDYRLIITIAPDQGPGAQSILDAIRRAGLEDIICNVGPVEMMHVPSLYKQCDGLLMPTLLESFSGTYVEAMFYGLPIFTTEADFARTVCGEVGHYFKPSEIDSVIAKLDSCMNNSCCLAEVKRRGREIVSKMPGWSKTYESFQKILLESL